MTVRTRLVLASFLMLFLELTLIRWLGANVVHLGYFTNFVLLGSFLGIGLGLLRSGRTGRPAWWSAAVLLALAVLVTIFPVTIDRSSGSVIYFTTVYLSGPPPWVALPLVFVAVAAVLVGPADVVGRCFRQLSPLDAYRLDLIGSLLGIGTFAVMSFLRSPSLGWALVVAAAWLALAAPRPPLILAVSVIGFVALLGVETFTAGVSWSPYYKVQTERTDSNTTTVSVNGVPHQAMQPIAVKTQAEPLYTLPYERVAPKPLGDVLIIGAGTGNDVALALAQGARSITAVEIDPRLRQIGGQEHPDAPYDDPRVHTVIDDGRAFLERTDQRFDLILFALPDSLALVNGAGGVRLESYLFTVEAVQAARDHLTGDGGFAMYNYYRESWLIDRLVNTVTEAFGHRPCVDVTPNTAGMATISAAFDAADQRCGATTVPVDSTIAPVHDDRPFLYVKGNSIPAFYLLAVAAILLVSILAVRLVGGPMRGMARYGDLFFMGAAFLLLETKSVTTFALLFGTTWLVNAIVFAGILLVVLLAVETVRRIRVPSMRVLFALLVAALGVAFVVPTSWVLGLPVVLRAVVAVALAFAPVFIANVAFAKRFSTTADSTTAFAVNILGAMLGGCLEYLAIAFGYRSLLLVAAVLYFGAFALLPRAKVAAAL